MGAETQQKQGDHLMDQPQETTKARDDIAWTRVAVAKVVPREYADVLDLGSENSKKKKKKKSRTMPRVQLAVRSRKPAAPCTSRKCSCKPGQKAEDSDR